MLNMEYKEVEFVLKGRYADRYRWENLTTTWGDGSDSRPTGQDIVDEENLRGKLTDKVFLVTGCSSGAGVATVEALAATGATVFGTARDVEKAKAALRPVIDGGRVHVLYMDHTDLATVRACAAEFLGAAPGPGRLNVLICNAAVMAPPYALTTDGFETQIATNHLAHFLLFELLKDALLASSTPEFNSRVISVSSTGHRLGQVDLEDLNYTNGRAYDAGAAYGQSKTACIWFANQVERLYGARGLHANSLMPGGWQSGLQKHVQAYLEENWNSDPKVLKLMCTVEQGCATSVWAAVSRDLDGKGGLYLEGCSVSGETPEGAHPAEYGHAPWAMDPLSERRLWDISKQLVGVSGED